MKIQVLFVDDNEPLLEVGSVYIERDAPDFEMTVANSASKALDLLDFKSFDVIISDYQMPVIDGLEFLARVRSMDEQIPFIIFTGKGREEIAIQALNLGATNYVVKGGDPKSQYAELIHIARTAVEHQREKQALSETEEQYGIVFEHANDGILMVEREQRKIQSANPKFCEMIGYTLDELLEFTIADIHPPEEMERIGVAFEMQARDEIRIAEKIPVLKKDGTIFYADISAKTLEIAGKQYQLGVFRDVTSKFEAETEHSAKDELYRLIAENSSDVIFTLDMNMNRTYLSPSVERLRGYTSEESLAQTWEEVMTKESLEKMIMLFGQGFERIRQGEDFKQPIIAEIEMYRKDGSTVWTEVSASAMYNKEGEPIGVIGLTRDISSRKSSVESLSKSEETFRLFFSNAPVYCYMVDPDGKILSVNMTALLSLGYQEDELVGEDIGSLYAPYEEQRVNDLVKVWRESGDLENEKIDIVTRDGTIRTVILSVSSVTDIMGELTHSIIIQRDISDSNLETSKRYKTLFDNANDAIFLMRDDIFIDCNDKTLEMFGCTQDQILGQPPYRYSPPHQPDGRDSMEKAMEKINGAIAGTPQFFYWKHSQYDGTLFDAEVSLNAIEIEGEILIQALVRDITKRTQAENDLRESEDRYRVLYENLPDGVIGVDLHTRMTFCNDKVLEMFGYHNEDQVIGRRLDEFLHPDYKKAAMEIFTSSLASGKTKIDGFEGIGLRADGSEIYFHQSSSLVKVDGKVVGIQSHIRDLSEWRETQEQLKQQREELGKFAHSMAHDLRSNIHVIVGLADLYQEDRKDRHLDDIIGIAGKMDSILSKSVALAEAGIIIGTKEFVNLEKLVREVAKTSIPDEIQLKLGELPIVNCDRAKMLQVIQNLMQNAHEHGEANSITVTSVKETGTYSLSIANDGIPIPEDLHNRFFEQGFSTKEKGGLGLSIIKSIIKAHGWEIILANTNPATIQIKIPSKDIRYEL